MGQARGCTPVDDIRLIATAFLSTNMPYLAKPRPQACQKQKTGAVERLKKGGMLLFAPLILWHSTITETG